MVINIVLAVFVLAIGWASATSGLRLVRCAAALCGRCATWELLWWSSRPFLICCSPSFASAARPGSPRCCHLRAALRAGRAARLPGPRRGFVLLARPTQWWRPYFVSCRPRPAGQCRLCRAGGRGVALTLEHVAPGAPGRDRPRADMAAVAGAVVYLVFWSTTTPSASTTPAWARCSSASTPAAAVHRHHRHAGQLLPGGAAHCASWPRRAGQVTRINVACSRRSFEQLREAEREQVSRPGARVMGDLHDGRACTWVTALRQARAQDQPSREQLVDTLQDCMDDLRGHR